MLYRVKKEKLNITVLIQKNICHKIRNSKGNDFKGVFARLRSNSKSLIT